MILYHDTEWGVPQHDDRALFELLILEGAQAGLSWSTILNKRAGYQRAFDRFDPRRVARYDDRKVGQLLANPEIVRNRLAEQINGGGGIVLLQLDRGANCGNKISLHSSV